MYLFLQNWRYTLIPALVAPIALLGTFAVMLALGFSINVLTMFGMVLAIGIIVDDTIVVVEGVERIMAEEGLPPREATIKAMRELTGAVIGITLVLTAVFIPMAFASGSVARSTVSSPWRWRCRSCSRRCWPEPDAGAVRDPAAPGQRPSRSRRAVRRLQPRLRADDRALPAWCGDGAAAERAGDGRVRRTGGGVAAGPALAAGRIPAGRRPGLFHDLDPAAGRGDGVRWPWSKPTNGTWPRVRASAPQSILGYSFPVPARVRR